MPSPFTNWIRRLRFGAPIVVVSGLPRSGTSMAMKMLEAGGMPLLVDGIRTADEDNPKGYYELERVKDLDKNPDKAWLKEARGKAVKIISFLLKDLPGGNNYKVLFMHRELAEVLASQAKMLDRRGEETKTDDARMSELYAKHLQKTRQLLAESDCFEVLELHYKQVIENPGESARRIQEFVELPLDVAKMTQVADKGLYRNRK